MTCIAESLFHFIHPIAPFFCHVSGKYLDPENPPTRACYAAKTLPLDAKVEIDAIAHL